MNKLIACGFLFITIFYSCTKNYDVHVAYTNTGIDNDTLCIFNNISGYMPIDSIRKLFSAGDTIVPNNRVIKGIVISDFSNGNFDSKNLDVQDSTGGIIVRFVSNHNVPLGSMVSINVSNKYFSENAGWLEIINVPNANVSVFETCVQIPVVVTITQINANLNEYESRLIRINNCSFSAGGANHLYNDSVNVADQTGNMWVYTKPGSVFYNTAYPQGNLVYVQGIVSDINGVPQFLLRSSDDVHKN